MRGRGFWMQLPIVFQKPGQPTETCTASHTLNPPWWLQWNFMTHAWAGFRDDTRPRDEWAVALNLHILLLCRGFGIAPEE